MKHTEAEVYFDLDTFLLDAAQALCIALPAAGIPAFLLRLTGRGWAVVAPVSVVATAVAISAAAAVSQGFRLASQNPSMRPAATQHKSMAADPRRPTARARRSTCRNTLRNSFGACLT